MLCAVGLVELRDLRNERIVRVRVGQQRRDRQEDLRNRQRRAPLVFQDIQTDRPIRRDVAMIDLRRKVDLCPMVLTHLLSPAEKAIVQ